MNQWRYYCLRFADQAQCDKVLQALGLLIEATDDEGNTILVDASQHQFVIDRIGTLYHPSGAQVTDPETGQKVPEMVASVGYHVNLCCNNAPLMNALRPFMVTPSLPKREFAGEMVTMKSQYADVPAKDRAKGFAVTPAEVEVLLVKDAAVLAEKLDPEVRKRAEAKMAEYTGKPISIEPDKPIEDIEVKP